MVRIAKSLDVLRSQINRMAPKRSKTSDGWLGDAAHRARPSDHNPNSRGVVCALDITHDPVHGVDAGKLAESLRASRDPRIKYLISNRRICSSQTRPWTWRPYSGANPHDRHVHVSVLVNKADDPRPWAAVAPATTNYALMTDITATVFGGADDPQTSAYTGKPVDPRLPGCALPYRFPKGETVPQVRVINRKTGQNVICDIIDVGPWNTNDPYWKSDDDRPQAETGKDKKGRKTNLAGIDLTPAAAEAIGLRGKGRVDWEFL